MKDIEIKISRETRQVELSKYVIGNDAENLQGNLVFTFTDEFVKGQARLEYRTNEKEAFLPLIQDEESYIMPIKSVITKQGQIFMQLVITEGIEEEEIPIFKSNVFYVVVNESINAYIEETDEYQTWIEIANIKLNQVDNLDISATKIDGIATITITKKDGTQEVVEILDGDVGTNAGTTNYQELENKPKINDIELDGNKSLEELGIQPKGDYLEEEEDPTVPEFIKNITEDDISSWNNKSNFSGNYEDLNNLPIIPDKTSQLNNDSGFVDEEYVKTKIENNTIDKQGILLIDLSNTNFSKGHIDKDTEEYNRIVDFTFNNESETKMILARLNQNIIDVLFTYDARNLTYKGTYDKGTVYEASITVNSLSNNFNCSTKALTFLKTDNTTSYSVSKDYNPAHKKYVDDSINEKIGEINTILATLTEVE